MANRYQTECVPFQFACWNDTLKSDCRDQQPPKRFRNSETPLAGFQKSFCSKAKSAIILAHLIAELHAL